MIDPAAVLKRNLHRSVAAKKKLLDASDQIEDAEPSTWSFRATSVAAGFILPAMAALLPMPSILPPNSLASSPGIGDPCRRRP